ncbi:MAG: histidine phosphatase family protein [Monoglobales bacterium]
MFGRIKGALDDIAEKHPNETICVVTHGTAIRALACLWRGVPLCEMQNIPWFDNASFSIVDYDGKNYTIIEENVNSHLDGVSTFHKQSWWQRYNEETGK